MNRVSAEKAAADSRAIATNPEYRTLVIEVDVTDPKQVDNMVAKVSKEFGRIDYAVNSAGVSQLDDSVLHAPLFYCSVIHADPTPHRSHTKGVPTSHKVPLPISSAYWKSM